MTFFLTLPEARVGLAKDHQGHGAQQQDKAKLAIHGAIENA
jgi:hypothetical protein